MTFFNFCQRLWIILILILFYIIIIIFLEYNIFYFTFFNRRIEIAGFFFKVLYVWLEDGNLWEIQ